MSRNRLAANATATAFLLLTGVLTAVPVPSHAAAPLPIAAIQGTGASTPYAGQRVTTTPSVVTAVYEQGPGGLRGFVLQTPGTGGPGKDLRTGSDAVFVYLGNAAYDVAIGDAVSVTGTASEFDGLTQIGGAVSVAPVAQSLAAPRPVTGLRWARTLAGRENLESMLYATREEFVVADLFPLRFGELALSAGRLPLQPTQVGRPGSARAERQEARNAATRVNLDDGSNRGFTVTPSLPPRQLPYLTPSRDLSVGDTLTVDEPVIIDFRNDVWKFNPTRPFAAGDEPVTIDRARPDRRPRVGGAMSVASFNVLNYFTTVAEGRPGCTGTNLDTEGTFNVATSARGAQCDVRGAYDAADLARQEAKIVDAINDLDASVVGLMEIENSARLGEPADEALATLVGALNRDAGERRWAYVPSSDQLQPTAEQDVITNALIYQPRDVRWGGRAWALGSAVGADEPFANARTPIAASFTPRHGGEPIVVTVNHFKSKSAGGATGENVDTGDGQGAYNADRIRQARAVAQWVPQLQAAARTRAVAIVGDLNAYAREDPIRVLNRAGFRDVAPPGEYSYVFGGLSGSLDHILLNRAARQRLVRADVWNINAGEAQAYEYSTYKTTAIDYYRPDQRRASDHDPVVAGLRRR